jgi:hypothetical protein
MGEVTSEVEQAIKTLNLSQEIIYRTERAFNESLYHELLAKFVDGKDRRWWWEVLKDSFGFVKLDYPPDHLNELIPDLQQNVWFMIEDDRENVYPIYDVKPQYIGKILSECFGFEYYIIDKKQTWLLCENHHKYLIGVGETLKNYNLSLIQD